MSHGMKGGGSALLMVALSSPAWADPVIADCASGTQSPQGTTGSCSYDDVPICQYEVMGQPSLSVLCDLSLVCDGLSTASAFLTEANNTSATRDFAFWGACGDKTFCCNIDDSQGGGVEEVQFIGVDGTSGVDQVSLTFDASRSSDGYRPAYGASHTLDTGDAWLKPVFAETVLNARLQGFEGADVLLGSGWVDVDNPDDKAHASNYRELLLGGDGADLIALFDGSDDEAEGGNGVDALHGGLGPDVLRGDNGDDLMCGGAETDTMRGGNDADKLCADDCTFTLGSWPPSLTCATSGSMAVDFLFGGGGADVAVGVGIDTIDGDGDADQVCLFGEGTVNGNGGDDDLFASEGDVDGGAATDDCGGSMANLSTCESTLNATCPFTP